VLRFGQKNVRETYKFMEQFKVGDAIKNVKMPTLAVYGAGEGGEPGRQADFFCANVKGPVTKYAFTVDQGADAHCQVGNMPFSTGVILDWLDEKL
jgi:hypothetical protein